MRIVLVEPNRIGLKLMTKMLVDGGHRVLPFCDGTEALAALRGDRRIDVLMTSFEIPNVSGLELCWEARLRAEAGRPIHVIAMSSNHDRDRLAEALDSGADDFIAKPPIATELYARLRAAARMTGAQRELIRLASRDALTDLPNRRAFLDRLISVCARTGASHPASLVCLDVDHFKAVNDGWGHAVGDLVLGEIAATLRSGPGFPGRIGGEEFALILDGFDLARAGHEAERIRLAVKERGVPVSDRTVSVSVSLGVAEHVPGEPVDALLRKADVALYAAKSNGRDRVAIGGLAPRGGEWSCTAMRPVGFDRTG